MKSTLLSLLVVVLFSASLSLAQSSSQKQKYAKFVTPDQEPQNVLPAKNLSRVTANQIGFTDYDYAGNSTVNEQVWPYDIDGDGTLDPVGTFMQRFSETEDGNRRVMMFVGLGGDFASFDASDRTLYTGWGTIQSITTGPWAGHAALMMHEGAQAKLTVINLATFTSLYFHEATDMYDNFPTFSYLDDGTISATLTDASFRIGYASTPTTYTEVNEFMVVSPSEYPIRRSPNGQYLAAVSEDGFQEVWLYISSDGGNTWSEELIGTNEVDEVVNRPGVFPLFTNFGQRSYAVDNNGVVHVGFNGYAIKYSDGDTTFACPAIYWNSRDRDWIAVSDPAEEGSELENLYPGNGVGNSYATPVVSEDGNNVSVLYQAPEYLAGQLQIYPGDGSADSQEKYYTDIKMAFSGDGGINFQAPVQVAGNPSESDVFPSAYDWLVPNGDKFDIHFMYMTDAIPGCSLFSENSGSEETYWSYKIFTFHPDSLEAPIPALWSASIDVSDAGGRSGETITFGQVLGATDGIDEEFGETDLPPLPPTGVFDARFILPDQTASLIDYRSTDLKEITWKFKIQASDAGYPVTLNWDPESFTGEGIWQLTDPFGGFVIDVDLTSQSSLVIENSSINELYINYKRLVCSEITVESNWNLISIPVNLDDKHYQSIFNYTTTQPFEFNGGYANSDSLYPAKGYWLKFSQEDTLSLCGEPVSDPLPLKAGWNMIGGYTEDIDLNNIVTNPAGIISSFFFEFDGVYRIASTMTTGKGYWVKVTQDGSIDLNAAGKKGNNLPEINESWDYFTVADNSNQSARLYLTKNGNTGFYNLPPVPPKDIFDARYSSDKFVENANSSWQRVNINSADYPVSISALTCELYVSYVIDGVKKEKLLSKGESLQLLDKNLSSIMVKKGGLLPNDFSLMQNFPNPFNPSTTIKYGLPVDSKVNIAVYNSIGQHVKTLLNSQVNAGYHEVKFNANELASGVYFYRIQAGSFIDTKKMLLIK